MEHTQLNQNNGVDVSGKQKILIICGPTATGKSAIGYKLARQLHGEIVSADSRQVYRGMDIGTGKDLIGWHRDTNTCVSVTVDRVTYHLHPYSNHGLRLWLYDIVNPDDPFSVGIYEKLAKAVIQSIHEQGKLPVVVGGSGLYLKSITHGISTSSYKPNEQLRAELAKISIESLQKQLIDIAPQMYVSLHQSDQKNPRRLIRKIELALAGNIELASNEKAYDAYYIGLSASREVLYKRIDTRVEERLAKGAENEIKQLLANGFSFQLPSMNTMGYREWKDMFENGIEDRKGIILKWKANEHAYAKRQMTWFKKISDIHWFDIEVQGWEANLRLLIDAWYNTINYANQNRNLP